MTLKKRLVSMRRVPSQLTLPKKANKLLKKLKSAVMKMMTHMVRKMMKKAKEEKAIKVMIWPINL
jgi:hypothetical protein